MLFIWSCNQKTEESNPPEEKRKKVELITDYGTMIIELYNETPLHRDNFINLAKQHAYDSLLFHRVINEFMIQGGDPDSRKAQPNDSLGEGDVPYVIDAEFNIELFHKKGALAAARDNNPEKASSGIQFYLVQGEIFNDSLLDKSEEYTNRVKAREYFKKDLKMEPILDSLQNTIDNEDWERYTYFIDSIVSLAKLEKNFKPYAIPKKQRDVYKSIGGTPHLDQNYTVFGEVVNGMEVLDSIASAITGSMDRPINDIRIQSVRVLE
jgi:peptidyl-prolyl cis-trans isomerase B (cyclophilin B)